jgi:hypothetical protein
MEDEQLARIESAFREVNEAIAKTADRVDADEVDVICECADPACAERLTIPLEEYESVRAGAARFIVAPGHEFPSIERIVEDHDEYAVVEKFGRRVRTIVRRLNPRVEPA